MHWNLVFFIQCGKASELRGKIKAEVCEKSVLYAIVLFWINLKLICWSLVLPTIVGFLVIAPATIIAD